MARNMGYEKAAHLQKPDANAHAGKPGHGNPGPAVPTHSNLTKPPAVDPPGGKHIGTQM